MSWTSRSLSSRDSWDAAGATYSVLVAWLDEDRTEAVVAAAFLADGAQGRLTEVAATPLRANSVA